MKRISKNLEFYLVLSELIKTTKGSDGKAKLETAIVNLGDLPISVKYFMEFMTEKMLKTDKKFILLVLF